MSRIWITSDLHLGHNKPFLYEPRGFDCIEDHDAYVVTYWNAYVEPEDTVYILGDLMLNDNEKGIEYLSQLNGKLQVIRGNHDTDARWELYKNLPNVELIGYAAMLKYKKYNFYLSHYPTLTANKDDEKPLKAKVINLCGHTHTNNPFADWDKGLIYHVEFDAHKNYPVLLDVIIEDIKKHIQEQNSKLEAKNVFIEELKRPAYTINSNIFTQARCDKCVYSWPMCGSNDSLGSCPNYKRDPPDGGYYG